jgi:hypothetical protein
LLLTIFAIAPAGSILTMPRRLTQITATMLGVRVVERLREIHVYPTSWYDIRGSPLSSRLNVSVNNRGLLLGQSEEFPAGYR